MVHINKYLMIVIALFCSHGSIYAMSPLNGQESISPSTDQGTISFLMQKTMQYAKQHPTEVAAITIVGIAAVAALYMLRFDGLDTIDPKAYCDWAEKQLN